MMTMSGPSKAAAQGLSLLLMVSMLNMACVTDTSSATRPDEVPVPMEPMDQPDADVPDQPSGDLPCDGVDEESSAEAKAACQECVQQWYDGQSDEAQCLTGDMYPDDLVTTCGDGFLPSWTCVRATALYGLGILGVTAAAIGVGAACTAGQAASPLPCVGAILALIAAVGGTIIALVDAIQSCEGELRNAACTAGSALRDALQGAADGVQAVKTGLGAQANTSLRDILPDGWVEDAIVNEFGNITIGNMLDQVKQRFLDLKNSIPAC